MEYQEFRRLYKKAKRDLSKLFMKQTEDCYGCSERDYKVCLTECKKLKSSLKEIKQISPFRFLAKEWTHRLFYHIKAIVLTRDIPLEVIQEELRKTENDYSVLLDVPEEDKETFIEVFSIFADKCKYCSRDISCFECEYVKALEPKFKTREGLRAFFFVVSTFKDLIKADEEEEIRIRALWKRRKGLDLEAEEIKSLFSSVWELRCRD